MDNLSLMTNSELRLKENNLKNEYESIKSKMIELSDILTKLDIEYNEIQVEKKKRSN